MSTRDFDDSGSRPLADDPTFMASLSGLDEGLGADSGQRTRPAQSGDPKVAPRVSAPTAPPAASLPPLPPLVTTPGGRPLLDLFPDALDMPTEQELRKPSLGEQRWSAAVPDRAAPLPYEAFYGLEERPFTLTTEPRFLYQSSEYDRVAQQMFGAIRRREPLVLLTGEIGIGKTTLCRAIVAQLDRHTLTSVVTRPFESVSDLLKTLLLDFGVASKDDVSRGRLASASQVELASALQEFLLSLGPLNAFAVVFIDEAQAVSPAVLSELRHLVSADDRMMQFVLVGQPALASTLDESAADLASAISLRLRLGPLAEDEVGRYVTHRLHAAGSAPHADFEDRAFARVYELTGGTPRLVNLLCDRALVNGFSRSTNVIDEALIDAAAEDLDMAAPAPRGALANLPGAGILLLLLLAGAVAALLTFHAELAAILSRLGLGPQP